MDEYTWADDRSIEERRMDEIVSKADIEELRDDILRCEGAVFVKLATLFFIYLVRHWRWLFHTTRIVPFCGGSVMDS